MAWDPMTTLGGAWLVILGGTGISVTAVPEANSFTGYWGGVGTTLAD